MAFKVKDRDKDKNKKYVFPYRWWEAVKKTEDHLD